ncbi:MAG: hypothetical protein PHW82_04970 [Bacteroidales bacterium]|nr:hypothetical protein [Bacteroidales bacterium]
MNLKHFNKSILFDLLGNNEANINILIDNYFKEIYTLLKQLRKSANNNDISTLSQYAKKIATASKSVCFELMHVMAIEIENIDISNTKKLNEFIDEMENELELIRDIINPHQ